MQQARDLRRHGIELDAGHMAHGAKRFGHQGGKQPRAHAGLEHAATAEPEPLHSPPDRTDDEFRRVVGILGAAGERSVVCALNRFLELASDLLLPLAELRLARTREASIRQFRRSEADKLDELGLLFWSRRAVLSRDAGRETDGREIVAAATSPGGSKSAIAIEIEIRAFPFGRSMGRRLVGRLLVVGGWRLPRYVGRSDGRRAKRASGGKRCGFEEIERE